MRRERGQVIILSPFLFCSLSMSVSFLPLRPLVLLCLLGLIVACDLRPVASGEWDVQISGPERTYTQRWLISDDGQVTIESGSEPVQITQAQLTGGRMSFSLGTDDDSGAAMSFSGTVDGNRFSGTLYTQAGNRPVSAQRR